VKNIFLGRALRLGQAGGPGARLEQARESALWL